MTHAHDNPWLLHGSAEPPPPSIPLQAGPWSLGFENGDLRCIHARGREVIRRIYGAVRDRNWGTVPGVISDLQCDTTHAGFRIRYTNTHRQEEIHFVWRAEIEGEADGSVRFTLDGEAKSTFHRNRIGLCVLHPIRECVGARCYTLHADRSRRECNFPRLIAADQPVDGFTNLTGLGHEVESDLWAELTFDGDLFETEDQRNWIDASFKTYSTPLRLPFPAQINEGTRIRQSVSLKVRSKSPSTQTVTISRGPPEPVRIHIREGASHRLPGLGLGMASHGHPLNEGEVTRLTRLGISHLRVDLRLAGMSWPDALHAAARDAMELGAALELAIHLPQAEAGDLAAVARGLGRLKVDLTRALIYRDGQPSTLANDLDAARAALGDCGMAIGAGTNADLYQLNLQRPPANADFICWSMNPQVHAFDDRSLAETPEGAAHQVASVRSYFPDLPLVVSPVTLKPRSNPVATNPAPPSSTGEWPPQVDPRQRSLLGAAWTVAMIKALAEGGTESVTLFETTGWRGVMETEAGSPMPEHFPSAAGEVFPIYHVLADVGELSSGRVLVTDSGAPQEIAPLLVESGHRRRLLLANLTAKPQSVSLAGVGPISGMRLLDGSTAFTAMTYPESFRGRPAPCRQTELTLPCYACATVDISQ